MAERVGMSAHPKSKALFDLAGPFSRLLQSVETGKYNTAANTPLVYGQPLPSPLSRNAEDVIDRYTLATGHDLKSLPVRTVNAATTAGLPVPRKGPLPQLAPPRPNGHARPGQ